MSALLRTEQSRLRFLAALFVMASEAGGVAALVVANSWQVLAGVNVTTSPIAASG